MDMKAATKEPGTYNPEATRTRLLDAALDQIWAKGFRSTSLDDILGQAGVTKGALYHHFKNKRELGLAVVNERVLDMVVQHWAVPLQDTDDPITAIIDQFNNAMEAPDEELERIMRCGCPLNNLAQEMSGIDEGFREALQHVFNRWHDIFTEALTRGQKGGTVRTDIDARHAAHFLMAGMEGSVGLTKNAQQPEKMMSCMQGARIYLEALRP
ncbi:TetR/AcrR family transcriptional regulator [bacterium AH-315-F18]|nr:TetR/AcrR family transcriptional regulator [bacterium AH-315-F18]